MWTFANPGIRRDGRTRSVSGFTLAEVAITIVIVGIAMVMMLQSLNSAKLDAAHTRNLKLARELGLLTLGEVEAGLHRDEIARGIAGTYADEGYPTFRYEVLVGAESFPDEAPQIGERFDSFSWRREREEEQRRDRGEDDPIREPYEKVRIRISFPQVQDLPNHLVLERWMVWDRVYGDEEDDGRSGGSRGSR